MKPSVVALGGALALLAAALGVRWLVTPPAVDEAAGGVAISERAAVDAPLAPSDVATPAPVEAARSVVNANGDPTEAEALPPFDATRVGIAGLDDDEFDAVVARVRGDRDALIALIEQARSETDPERLAVLLMMLGDIDDPAVLALASELVYSGDPASRQQGLDLLKRLRPGDPDALAVVSNLLSSETESDVLVPALTALARPGGADDGTRASLVEQVAVLSDHEAASVRRTSITILARWSDDPSHTPILADALQDADASVQRAAAFAFVDRPSDDPAVHRALFAVAEDDSLRRPTRRGALLSLKSMPLEPADEERAARISRSLDTR